MTTPKLDWTPPTAAPAPRGFRKILDRDDQGNTRQRLVPNEIPDLTLPDDGHTGGQAGAALPPASPTPPRTPKTEGGTIRSENPDDDLFRARPIQDVVLSPALSVAGRHLYTVLTVFARRKGHCWPGQKRLCGILRLQERQLRNLLTELEQFGLIEISRLDMNHTNHYLLKAVTPLLGKLHAHETDDDA